MPATSSADIWRIIESGLEKGMWYALREIYALVQKSKELTAQDLEPASKGSNEPRWQQHVRNALQYGKSTFEIFWGRDGRYMLPLSHDEIVMASSVPVKGGFSREKIGKLRQQSLQILGEARELVFEYERRRLINTGEMELAGKVKLISEENSGAGYDLNSFDDSGEKNTF